MPRRNGNVRERNIPAAAQKQRRTLSTQSDARSDRRSSRQPTAEDRADAEFVRAAKRYSQAEQ